MGKLESTLKTSYHSQNDDALKKSVYLAITEIEKEMVSTNLELGLDF